MNFLEKSNIIEQLKEDFQVKDISLQRAMQLVEEYKKDGKMHPQVADWCILALSQYRQVNKIYDDEANALFLTEENKDNLRKIRLGTIRVC